MNVGEKDGHNAGPVVRSRNLEDLIGADPTEVLIRTLHIAPVTTRTKDDEHFSEVRLVHKLRIVVGLRSHIRDPNGDQRLWWRDHRDPGRSAN